MKKILLILITLSLSNIVYGQTTRWKPMVSGSEIVWDSQSAKKININSVRFWYISPILEEQKNLMIKLNMHTRNEVDSISYGRTGVVAKCNSMEYAIFQAEFLTINKTPIDSGANVSDNKLEFKFIQPDTNIEDLVTAVCKYLKIK